MALATELLLEELDIKPVLIEILFAALIMSSPPLLFLIKSASPSSVLLKKLRFTVDFALANEEEKELEIAVILDRSTLI